MVVRKAPQRGFTLLEAVVALAILATSAIALYGWLNTNLIILKRVDDVYQTAAVAEAALEWVSALDPYEHKEGSEDLLDSSVTWQFVPITEQHPANDMHGNLSVNDIQLFRADIEIVRSGRVISKFDFLHIGLQQKREVNELVF